MGRRALTELPSQEKQVPVQESAYAKPSSVAEAMADKSVGQVLAVVDRVTGRSSLPKEETAPVCSDPGRFTAGVVAAYCLGRGCDHPDLYLCDEPYRIDRS
jgi:hypothetical protein